MIYTVDNDKRRDLERFFRGLADGFTLPKNERVGVEDMDTHYYNVGLKLGEDMLRDQGSTVLPISHYIEVALKDIGFQFG